MRGYTLKQADGTGLPGCGWRFVHADFRVEVLAREFRAVRGKGRVVGISGGVLRGRVEWWGFTDAGMPGNEGGRQ